MTALGGISSSSTIQSGDVGDFNTAAYTRVKAMLVAGTNVTLTSNDGAGTITVNSSGGGGGAFIDSKADTNTVALTVAAGQLSAAIPTTATPQVARQGIGVAADASILFCVGAGDNPNTYAQNTTPHRVDIKEGTYASPITSAAPLARFHQISNYSSTPVNGGAVDLYGTLYGIHHAKTGSKAQPIGVVGWAINDSTVTPKDLVTANTDAVGLCGLGTTASGNTTGRAIGGFFQATTVSSGQISALEIVCRNDSATAGTFNTTGFSGMVGVAWFNVGSNTTGAALQITNPYARTFEVGIGIDSTYPITLATFRDNGNATTSLHISGTHTSALMVASTGGDVRIGTTAPATAAKVTIQNTSDIIGLRVIGNSTQTASIFSVTKNDTSNLFNIQNTGQFNFVDGALLSFGTTTGTKIGITTSQKIGFYNATPIVQPSGIGAAATDLATVITLANNMRTAAINIGLMAA